MKPFSRVALACAVMAALLAVVQSQDKPKAPWEWKLTGDAIEALKIEITLHEKIDQSSPEALAASYAMLIDHRDPVHEMKGAVEARWVSLLEDHMQRLELQIMTESAREAMLSARSGSDESEYTFRQAAAKVGDVEKIDDSNSWVNLTRAVERQETNSDTGDVNTVKLEFKTRIHARKGADGLWRIEASQEWGKDWEKSYGREDVFAWSDTITLRWFLEYMEFQDDPKIPALKQDTPESAAASAVDWLGPTRRRIADSVESRLISAWGKHVLSLYSDTLIANTREAVKVSMEKEKAHFDPKGARKVESITDGENGIKKVKFKPSYEWSVSVEVHVQKVGDVWKAVAGGYYERDGAADEESKFVAEPNFYQLSWR